MDIYTLPCKYDGLYNEQTFNQTFEANCALLERLKIIKNKINNKKNWDVAKKFANTYEFIFSFNNDGVADIIPISRSYFKLVEILNDNQILANTNVINACCLCEGPGGFIQAINDIYHGKQISPINCITLISYDKKIPNWKLNHISNYTIHYGKDNTGNLYDIDNIYHFVEAVGKQSCNLVTADGGFDFSKDFNSQENDFLLLLLCEIFTCLNVQAEGGVFVVKVFDLFQKDTINLVSLLRLFYKTITIQKPVTSRPANSEKYLVCRQFHLGNNGSLLQNIESNIIEKNSNLNDIIPDCLKLDTLTHILEYNDRFVEGQIYHIEKTLHLIKTNYFNKKENIRYCIDWCKKYNIPIKPSWA
jgi:23S rRNA U2552 (ribose-2'-O)-methylase RlmE/FtsJ